MKNTSETKILGNVTADNQKSDLVWTAGLFFFFSPLKANHQQAIITPFGKYHLSLVDLLGAKSPCFLKL